MDFAQRDGTKLSSYTVDAFRTENGRAIIFLAMYQLPICFVYSFTRFLVSLDVIVVWFGLISLYTEPHLQTQLQRKCCLPQCNDGEMDKPLLAIFTEEHIQPGEELGLSAEAMDLFIARCASSLFILYVSIMISPCQM